MSTKDLTNCASQVKVKAEQGLSVRSLDDLPTSAGSGEPENLAIIADGSGSMSSGFTTKETSTALTTGEKFDEWGNPVTVSFNSNYSTETKIAAENRALQLLYTATDFSAAQVDFWIFGLTYHEAGEVAQFPFTENEKPPVVTASGGTPMAKGLRAALVNPARNRIIVLSDGEPDGGENSVWPFVIEAKNRSIKIDTIFIGDAGSADETLMRKMSEHTGGKFCTADNADSLVESLQELETHAYLQIGYDGGALEDKSGSDVIKL